MAALTSSYNDYEKYYVELPCDDKRTRPNAQWTLSVMFMIFVLCSGLWHGIRIKDCGLHSIEPVAYGKLSYINWDFTMKPNFYCHFENYLHGLAVGFTHQVANCSVKYGRVYRLKYNITLYGAINEWFEQITRFGELMIFLWLTTMETRFNIDKL